MEMTVCLDTSAYIAMFRGRKAVARFLAECETIVVPAAARDDGKDTRVIAARGVSVA